MASRALRLKKNLPPLVLADLRGDRGGSVVTFQTYFHLGVKVWLKNDNLGPKRPDKIFIREYKIPSYLTYFDLWRVNL